MGVKQFIREPDTKLSKAWRKRARSKKPNTPKLITTKLSEWPNVLYGSPNPRLKRLSLRTFLRSPNDSSVFKIAKQMDRRNQDVVGEKCIKNDAGELTLSDDEKMKAWVEHYSRLLNVEFEWPSDLLPEIPPVEGPPSSGNSSTHP